MASTIITKNGVEGGPSELVAGELAINTTTGNLYYGSSGTTNSVSSSFNFGAVTASFISASGTGTNIITAGSVSASVSIETGRILDRELTSGRVIFAGTNGRLSDDGDLTFLSDTLTATKIGAFEAAGAIDFSDENMTNVDINSGTIDGTDVTVGSGKTLDVSGGTLTTSATQKAAIVNGVGTNVDIGAFELRAKALEADVADGTAPLTIASTTVVANLNADKLDGADLIDEDNMASNSVTAVPTQQSVKAYVDGKVKQIVNLKGYATLQNNVYDFAEDYVNNKAPWLIDTSYGSGTINNSTEVNQSAFFRAGGFHVPFACTLSALQVQGTVNGSGDGSMSIAVVEYRPSKLAADTDDYPRTIYETVVVASNNHNSKVETVDVTAGNLDETELPAGSHLLIMVKGDSDTAGDTGVVSVSIGLSW